MISLRWVVLVATASFAACANLAGIDDVHSWKGAAGGSPAVGSSGGAPMADAAGGSPGDASITDAAGGSPGDAPLGEASPPTFTVVGTTPADQLTGVEPPANVNITFSDPLDTQSVNASTVRLLLDGQVVPCDVAAGERSATLTPKDPPLALAARYSIELADVILDTAHHSLGGQRTFAFTTRDVTKREPYTTWPANYASPLPRISINARGNAYAIFGGRRMSGAGASTAFLYRYDVSGSVWTMGTSYDTSPIHMVASSDVAIDDQDRVCATWCTRTSDGGGIVNAAWYPIGAGQWTPTPTDANAPDDFPAYACHVALAKSGMCKIVWGGRKPGSSGTTDNVMSWVRSVESGSSTIDTLASQPLGSTWTPVPVVAAGPMPTDIVTAFADPMSNIVASGFDGSKTVLATGGSKAPAVAVDSVGNAIVVWERSDSAVTAYASRLPHGGSWSPMGGTPISDGLHNASNLAVAASAGPYFMAVWQQEQRGSPPVRAIFANRWLPERGGWEGPRAIPQTDTTTDAVTPHVALDTAGNAIATWQQAGKDIWIARFVAGAWQPAQKLSTGQPGSDPRAALDSRGRGFVIWAQSSSVVVARFQ